MKNIIQDSTIIDNIYLENAGKFTFHSYHYELLLIQLAIDSTREELLFASAQDSYYDIFKSFKDDGKTFDERLELYLDFAKRTGIGLIEPAYITKDCGEVKIQRSHIDEGWLRKWGKSDRPINIIMNGFVCAMFSALFNEPKRAFHAIEMASIAEGERLSTIKIIRN